MNRASNSGFTIYEVVIVIGLTTLLLSVVTPIFTSNTNMADATLAQQRLEAAHRRNLVALSHVLRGIDLQTLTGFDAGGASMNPHFARVTGADLDDLTYGGSEELRWVPSPIAVDGVPSPGSVYLVRAGARTLVADRVPSGGFRVRQEGQNLVVQLATYWTTSSGKTVTKTGETVVSVRN